MDRLELQKELITNMLDEMDSKTMWQALYELLHESYDKYSEEELKSEVEYFYPELLDWN